MLSVLFPKFVFEISLELNRQETHLTAKLQRLFSAVFEISRKFRIKEHYRLPYHQTVFRSAEDRMDGTHYSADGKVIKVYE